MFILIYVTREIGFLNNFISFKFMDDQKVIMAIIDN